MRLSRAMACAWLMVLLTAAVARGAEPQDGTFTASDGVKIHYLSLG